MSDRLVILLAGMVGGTPGHGGASWAVLQYLHGLRRLGHRAVLVEPVAEDPSGPTPLADSAAAAYFCAVTARHGIEGALVRAGTTDTVGMSYAELTRVAGEADLVLDIGGMLRDPELLGPAPRRVYLDLDPAFVQLWHEVDGLDMGLDGHTHFVTLSDRVGETIPDCGRDWIPTLPPVVLDAWPVATQTGHDALTTVANWRAYGSIHHDGRLYGQKAHSLRPLFGLPGRVDRRFVLALGIHADEREDLESLRAEGWDLLDPAAVTSTPERYRGFVQRSWAEFGVAKSGYVVSDSGWFSDRSACYLASGRPVLAQDTGFGRRLPTGDGLVPFTGIEDAADAVEDLVARYDHHRRAARAVAEEHLDSDRVLTRLLDRVLG